MKDLANESPSRTQVLQKFTELLDSGLPPQSRHDVSAWACHWIVNDLTPLDENLWHSIKLLGAADLKVNDREYLYQEEDYLECLSKLFQ